MNLKPNNFDFWIENNLNVLLRGKHGVGKTAMVVDAFERNNLKYKYFSASTMDTRGLTLSEFLKKRPMIMETLIWIWFVHKNFKTMK